MIREESNVCTLVFAATLIQPHRASSAANKPETQSITMILFSASHSSTAALCFGVYPVMRCSADVFRRHAICILRVAAWAGNRAEVCQTTAESSLIGNPCVQRAWQDNYLPPFISHAALSRHFVDFCFFFFCFASTRQLQLITVCNKPGWIL